VDWRRVSAMPWEDRHSRPTAGLTRREFLQHAALAALGAGFLSSCQRSGAAPPQLPSIDAKPDGWAELVAAARQEGTVVVYGPPGAVYRQVIVDAFEAAYPDVNVEALFATGNDHFTRISTER